MRRRLPNVSNGFAFALACLFAFLLVPTALGNSAAGRYLNTSCCALKGSRATILSPLSSEGATQPNQFFDSAVYADNDDVNNGYLIQTGVTQVVFAPQGPSCQDNGLYYFVEIMVANVAHCYYQGGAAYGTGHLHSVVRNADGYWRAYLDGVYTGVSNAWSRCGGDACLISAWGEELSGVNGHWEAKFAGSGNTPWQRWTGSTWYTIQSSYSFANAYWTLSGPFPAGIWKAVYNR